MNQYPDDFSVTLVHAAGNADARCRDTLQLFEIDRSAQIDAMTTLLPARARRANQL